MQFARCAWSALHKHTSVFGAKHRFLPNTRYVYSGAHNQQLMLATACSLFPYFCSSDQSLLFFKFKTFVLNTSIVKLSLAYLQDTLSSIKYITYKQIHHLNMPGGSKIRLVRPCDVITTRNIYLGYLVKTIIS